MRILIVDDSNITRIILKKALVECLGSEKLSIEEVADGDIAIERIDAEEYDFIYLDLNMPKVGGKAVLEHMKAKQNNAKIVVCSVNNDYKVRREVEAYGIFAYVVKPFTAEKIKEIMREYITL